MVVGLGGGGLELRLSPCPMEELDAVDVVSVALALAVVSVGFNAVVSDSIFGNGSTRGVRCVFEYGRIACH